MLNILFNENVKLVQHIKSKLERREKKTNFTSSAQSAYHTKVLSLTPAGASLCGSTCACVGFLWYSRLKRLDSFQNTGALHLIKHTDATATKEIYFLTGRNLEQDSTCCPTRQGLSNSYSTCRLLPPYLCHIIRNQRLKHSRD